MECRSIFSFTMFPKSQYMGLTCLEYRNSNYVGSQHGVPDLAYVETGATHTEVAVRCSIVAVEA